MFREGNSLLKVGVTLMALAPTYREAADRTCTPRSRSQPATEDAALGNPRSCSLPFSNPGDVRDKDLSK